MHQYNSDGENSMKTKIALGLFGVILLSLGTIARAQSADATAEKAVTAAEEQWAQSERTNNVDLLAPLLADKFIDIDTDGSISSRAKFLADSKASKFTSVDIQDLHITVVGQTAIATMVFKTKGTDAKGKPMEYNARWADTYVKMPDGKWQCVLSQGSDLKK
jgi:ketosteroid isomerase-like protein